MAYLITCTANVSWVPDGAGQMSVPSAQTLQVSLNANMPTGTYTGTPIVVPGGDSPSTGNISTACTTLGTSVATLFNNNIATIQGWSTGGD